MQEREIHLRDYLKVIDKRRYSVYTFFIIVFTLVLIGTLSSQPVYMASTKILIERGAPADLERTYYLPYDPEFYETQYQLIKSVSVAERVVKMLGYDKNPDLFFSLDKRGDSFISDVLAWAGNLFSLFVRNNEDVPEKANDKNPSEVIVKTISSGISVRPIKNSKIVEISYESTSPRLAATIANAAARAYMEQILEMKMNASRYTLQWMTKKAEEEKAKLERSEKALQEYMKKNDIVTLENRVTVIPQKLAELSTELVKAETKRKELEVLYRRVRKYRKHPEKAETMPAIASDPTVQSLREQILKAEQNIMELSKKYGYKHPVMKRAVSELEVLKERKTQEIQRVIDSIKNDYELALSKERDLKALLARTKSEALDLNEKFIQYGILKREVETNRQLYDALMKKIKEQSVTEKIQPVNVWIVEKAEIPESPVKPRKALNLLLGIIVGLFGGIGIAFFIEYLDNTIKSPDDAEARLGKPVLGVIPLLKEKGKTIEDIVLKEPRSSFAEDYKVLRTSLLLSSAEAPPKTVLITSTGPEEGKTVTAINLATAIAQSEYSVLLMDADLRKPRIHKIYSLRNDKGLSTYLAGGSDINIIREGPLPNLSVIPSGPIPPNPSELLGSKRMKELLETLRGSFDVIIIDSPPVLTVSDSLVMGKMTDGVLLVTRGGKTTYELSMRSIKSISDMKANLLGIVINAIDMKRGDYYYYRYYNYYSDDPQEIKERPVEGMRRFRWLYVPLLVIILGLLAIIIKSYVMAGNPGTPVRSGNLERRGTAVIADERQRPEEPGYKDLSETGETANDSPPLIKRYIVTTELLNIRKNPSVLSPVVGRLKKGEAVYAIAVKDNWYELYPQGSGPKADKQKVIGYVSGDYLRAEANSP